MKLRRMVVVPVRIERHIQHYMLAVLIESRNGTMVKHVPGLAPFDETGFTRLGNVLKLPVIDQRLPIPMECLNPCSGCRGGWCYGCIPDYAALEEYRYLNPGYLESHSPMVDNQYQGVWGYSA